MIKLILNWLSGGLADALTAAYKAKVNSNTEADRIRAGVIEKDIEARIDARRQATEIRLATAGFWEMRLLTFVIAAPFALHALLVGLDTSFGFGWRIAAYPEPFQSYEGTVLLSFFGVQVASKALDTAAFIFGRRG